MKTNFFYHCAIFFFVFLSPAHCIFAQNSLSGSNAPLISSGINNDKANPAVQSVDDGLYIYRPNFVLGFSPFSKGFWKLSRFGYYNWVYNLYDYTLNNYYDYYNRGYYGGWLYGRVNMYGFNGWNYNQALYNPNLYFKGLYGMNGIILYKPLISLKNTNVSVPLTAANNYFLVRLFEKNKLPSEYADSFDDKTEKKPKLLNLSTINTVPVEKTENISKRETKKIDYYYKTKFDDYYNSLNRNFSKSDINSYVNSGRNGTVSTGNPSSVKSKDGNTGSHINGSTVTKSSNSGSVTNNQSSKSNSNPNNSGTKQQSTGSTKK